ncbi:hypothetical protein BDV98DRAFT_593386 [Pterulicium gracile]|uniref:Uncharacterized protein n=1 Tax=Pterulicium gracile TaxID=1884261 RepID=A0A5C3QFT3_9AGAR|nr:hypothetical protein BDV98DRAFT_593386 [Pterula gracilis]
MSALSKHRHSNLQYDNHGANLVPANTDAASDSHPGCSRPGLTHQTFQHTQYVDMLLALDGIPKLHNILTVFFARILLAEFILFPGTFTSLKLRNKAGDFNEVSSRIVGAINTIPL